MIRRQSLWAMLLAILFAITVVSPGDAEAKKKRKKKSNKTSITTTANTKALRELMGAFKFGMSPDEAVGVITKQISERYAEQVAATNDVYEQDKLRKKRDKEIKSLRASMVKFDGKKSGWDVSIIDDQFSHNTDESMMVYWETHQGKNQRRFFFFHEDRLWKMFIALDTSTVNEDQRTFEFFKSLMEQRFGKGEARDQGISWRLRDIHVDAWDQLAFYNAFCLIITDPRRSEQVLAVRQERGQKPKERNTVIEAITSDGKDEPSLDDRSNTIDTILKNQK